jgi:CHAT domain-containing protein
MMNVVMDMGDQVERWLADELPPEMLLTPLSDKTAREVVERLKEEVDRNWSIDLDRAFELASRIVTIGRARLDSRQEALGLMAQGDILKYLDRYEEAWDKLDEAGKMFTAAEDKIGWARTRVGQVVLGLKLNRLPDALADVERARQIFSENGEQEKLVRLEINTAYIYAQLGDQHQALRLNHSALAIAEALGDAGQRYIGLLHMNIGVAHDSLGNFQEALTHYEQASASFRARNEPRYIANIDLNIAYIAHAQGHYRRALQLVYGILEGGINQFPLEAKVIKRDLTEFYLYLNRYSDARDLARQIVNDYRSVHATYDIARVLLHLATAEAELGNFTAALTALDEAESIFKEIKAITWTMITRIRHGQVALKQGDLGAARHNALVAATYFKKEDHPVNSATTSLLISQVALASGDLTSAAMEGNQALHIAQRYNIPTMRYAAYLLLGQAADFQLKTGRAIRCYQAATATIDRVQRGLTITLRSSFLEDKGQAWRELIALYLRLGRAECAFDALERSKSQVLLNYIANREQFRWTRNDPQSRMLIVELDRLRAEHQSFYRLAHDLPKDQEYSRSVKPEQFLAEVAIRERRMRAITEQLYLNSSTDYEANTASLASLQDIQSAINRDALLIEFYNDGTNLWAFTLDGKTCDIQRLPMTADKLNQLLAQLQTNLGAALKVDSRSSSARTLTQLGQRILQRLYSLLLEPLELQRRGRERLMIVPYGALHYLPFNLLYDGSAYLIEHFEVVILPAASLITRHSPKRPPRALALSHSWEGRLPYTQAEAHLVHQLFGGMICMEDTASRIMLQTPPAQILHIAAHGQHRLDQPDMSYIELADGQLYADDLLQQDLSYELVTLSACETGRANVAADEELIGIGRGLLYAGAGALILSLWQVTDSSTVSLMQELYQALQAGRSKSAALREAQLSFLIQNRQQHPALWGAFQLIGDASPLSMIHE